MAAVLLGWALLLRAQQSVTLQFNDGHVTLSAQNAPVLVIIAEWARFGAATIVNGDRVAGLPVTLELTAVPERQALDIVLRGVAGYMLAPRQAGSRSTSAFDRIVILPTSVAPKNPPPAPVASVRPRPAVRRPGVIARFPEAGVKAPIDAGQTNQPPADEPVRHPVRHPVGLDTRCGDARPTAAGATAAAQRNPRTITAAASVFAPRRASGRNGGPALSR